MAHGASIPKAECKSSIPLFSRSVVISNLSIRGLIIFCSLSVNDTQCIIDKVFDINGKDSVKDGNGLGNLVLLDASINRAYKNAVFPEKRKKIIEAIGQGKHYLLPCTEMAFMKFYTKDATRMDRWLQQDFEDYQKAMEALQEDIFKEKDFHLPAHSVKLDLAPDVETTLKEKPKMADNPSNPWSAPGSR